MIRIENIEAFEFEGDGTGFSVNVERGDGSAGAYISRKALTVGRLAQALEALNEGDET